MAKEQEKLTKLVMLANWCVLFGASYIAFNIAIFFFVALGFAVWTIVEAFWS